MTRCRPAWIARLSAVIVAAALLTAGAAGQALGATSCRPVAFVGARGSGEASTASGAFGNTVHQALARFEDRASIANVEEFPVPYPAVAVLSLDPGDTAASYASSEAAGRESVVDYIQASNSICPNQVFVLAGYSQGADVVADAAASLSSDLRKRVVGIALFGDPQFNPDSEADSGGASGLHGLLGVRGEFPDGLSKRTKSYCRPLDGVCNGGPADSATAKANIALTLAGQGGHFEYAEYDSAPGGDFLADQYLQADVAVAVDPPAGAVAAGGTASFGVRARNAGLTPVSGITVNPAVYDSTGRAWSGAGTGWTCDTDTGSCTYAGSVAAGATAPTLTITSTVKSTPGGTVTVQAQLTSPSDANSGNDRADASAPIGAGPTDVAVAVDPPAGAVAAGGTASFGVRARNAGLTPVSGITVNPAVYDSTGRAWSGAGTGWTCDTDTGSCTYAGSVAAGATPPTLTITSTVKSTPGGTVTVQAQLTSPSDANSGNDRADASAPIGAGPTDVAVAVDPPAGAVAAGGTASFGVRARNAGLTPVSGITVNPAVYDSTGRAWSGAGTGWTCDTDTGSCTYAGSVAAGATPPTLTITSTVKSTPGGTVTVQAQLTSPSDANSGNDRADASAPIGAGPTDVAVAVDPPAGAVAAGGTASFGVRARNAGLTPVSGITVNPAVYDSTGRAWSGAGTGWTCDTDTGSCTYAGSVAAGATPPTLTITSTVKSTPGGTVTVQAQLTSPSDANSGNDRADASAPIKGSGTKDVVVTAAGSGAPFVLGTTASYTVTVRNLGTSATSGTTSVDFGGSFASATGSGWTCDLLGTCTRSTSLAAGAAAPALTVKSTTSSSGSTLYASVTNAADSDHTNDAIIIDSTSRRAPVDVVVTAAGSGAPFVLGTTASYTVTVRNLGTSATSGTTSVDFGGSFASATGSGWTCDLLGTCTRSTSLAAGAAAPALTVKSTTSSSGSTLYASVTNAADSDHTNDAIIIDSTSRRAPVDVVVTAAGSGAPFVLGTTASYTVTVRNLGTSATSGTTSVDFGGSFASATGSGWTCDLLGTCTRSTSLAAGAAAPALTVKSTTSSSGSTLYASVTNAADSDHTNDAIIIDSTSRRAPVDVVVTAAGSGAPFVLGTTASYTVTVRNLGTSATSGTTSVDFGGSFASATGSGWTCDLLGTCTRSTSLAAGAAAPALTVKSTTSSSGSTLYASVTNAADSDHTNDAIIIDSTSVLR